MRRVRPQNSSTRSGMWSQNKFTNLTPYDPYFSEADRIAEWAGIDEHEGETLYFEWKPAPGLIQPLTLQDVRSALGRAPEEFTKDLKGVFLCRGSRKQLQTHGITYGCYSGFYRSIFLFPFYESRKIYYHRKPKPSISMEYERHGAVWNREERGWNFEFSPESLRSFYTWDVLYHELGHHIDYMNGWDHKNDRQRERFAEWFAMEYGMRKKEEK